jgi:hypothetical protein
LEGGWWFDALGSDRDRGWAGVTLIWRDNCEREKSVEIKDDCKLEGKEVDGRGKEGPARKEKRKKK